MRGNVARFKRSRLGSTLYGKLRAALAAAAAENVPAGSRLGAHEKPVRGFSFAFFWLVGALHECF